MTLTSDLFPNNTTASNYFTATGGEELGKITGSVTSRLTIWRNYSRIRYTPTSTPTNSETGSERVFNTASAINASGSGTASASQGSSASVNAATATEMRIVGSLLALALGITALL